MPELARTNPRRDRRVNERKKRCDEKEDCKELGEPFYLAPANLKFDVRDPFIEFLRIFLPVKVERLDHLGYEVTPQRNLGELEGINLGESDIGVVGSSGVGKVL